MYLVVGVSWKAILLRWTTPGELDEGKRRLPPRGPTDVDGGLTHKHPVSGLGGGAVQMVCSRNGRQNT